jgi:beta-galactosidase
MFNKILLPTIVILLMATTVCFAETYFGEPNNRVKMNMSATPWKFIKADPAGSPQTPAFNDAGWQTVGIPHTWGDTLSFLNLASSSAGPGYDASTWYRHKFALDNAYSGKKIFIEFRGA